MSTIKLTGTSSGSSIIKAPDSGSTNQTFTLPASSGTLVTTANAGVAGITSAADATAITINSSEKVGIGIADAHHMLHIKENSTSNSLASGVKVQITNEQGAGNFASLRFTGSNQNGFIGYRDGANDQDRRISIGIGADAEHISFSQAGIKFNGDTAEANGLDDYEEGTFTLSIQDWSSATFSLGTIHVAKYTKIGNTVTIWWNGKILSSVNNPGGGDLKLSGFPYASAVSKTVQVPVMFGHDGTAVLSYHPRFQFYNTFGYFYAQNSSGVDGTATHIFKTSTEVGLNFTYLTA